jgi:protein KRI1
MIKYRFIFIEVLSAPDRELNAWCSLKKTCVYQDDKDELKDIETYKSKANDIQLKKKVIPSLFNEDGTEDALETEQEKKSAKSKTRRKQKRKKEYIAMTLEDNISGSTEDTISKKAKYNEEMKECPAEINDKTVTEKKKRRNKKQNKHAEIPDSVSEKPKSIDKYKPSPFSKTGKFGVNKQTNKKTEVNAAMRMSDKRLEAYGIAPNTFKRKKIKEKYKQRDK